MLHGCCAMGAQPLHGWHYAISSATLIWWGGDGKAQIHDIVQGRMYSSYFPFLKWIWISNRSLNSCADQIECI